MTLCYSNVIFKLFMHICIEKEDGKYSEGKEAFSVLHTFMSQHLKQSLALFVRCLSQK